MLTNKEVHKITVKKFNDFFRSIGYKRTGSRTWYKIVNNELLQQFYLAFSYGREIFDLDIAFMPLCVPASSVYLNFSTRLHRFDKRDYHAWGSYDAEQLDIDISDAEKIISDEVFPWLESIDGYEKFVSLLHDSEGGKEAGFFPLRCHVLEVLPDIFFQHSSI